MKKFGGELLIACLLAIGIMFVIFVAVGTSKTKAEESKAKQEAQQLEATRKQQEQREQPHVLSECTTPCTTNVGWGQKPVWQEGHPMKIKFKGIDWVTFTGVKGQYPIVPGNPQPGDAEFVSLENLHLLVQILDK